MEGHVVYMNVPNDCLVLLKSAADALDGEINRLRVALEAMERERDWWRDESSRQQQASHLWQLTVSEQSDKIAALLGNK